MPSAISATIRPLEDGVRKVADLSWRALVTSFSENLRQTVHVAMAGLALLLRYMSWRQAAGLVSRCCSISFRFPAGWLRRIYRATDRL